MNATPSVVWRVTGRAGLLAGLAAALALGLGPAGGADAQAPQDALTLETGKAPPPQAVAAETGPDAAAAEAVRAEVIVDAPAAEKGAPDSPAPAKRPGKALPDGRREMALEEIEDLPVLRRYELPFERGEALLEDVKDYTYDYDESAFWWLVSRVAELPAESFKAGEVSVGFPELLATPSAHRGKPVTLRGAYVTCAPLSMPILALRKEVPTLYVCNIRELPLEQERPVATVVVLEDPMPYLRVWDQVRVKGYFYKIRKYRGTKGEDVAPMIVGRRLEAEEVVRAGLRTSGPFMSGTQITAGLMFAVIIILAFVFFYLRQRTKASVRAASQGPIHRFRLQRPDRPTPPAPGGTGGAPGEPKP